MEFINTGMDERILKSLDVENPSEELIKAMSKQGLVQKEVQVKGKNGQTFTRKQWVKAGDTKGSATPHPTVNTSTSNHKQEFISALKGIQNQNTRDEFIRIYDNIDRIAAFTRNSKDKDRYFGRDRTKQQYFKDRIQNDIFNNIKWKDDLNFSSYKEVRQVITDTYKDYVQEFDETKNAVASNSKYTYKWNATDQLYDVLDSSGKVHTQASTKDEAEKIVKNNGAVNTKKTKDAPQIPPQKKDMEPHLRDKTVKINPADLKVGDYIKYVGSGETKGETAVIQVKEITKSTLRGVEIYHINRSSKYRTSCRGDKTLDKYDTQISQLKFDKTKSGTVGGIQVGKELATVVKTANGKKLREVTDPDTGKVYEIHADTSSNKPDGIVAVEKVVSKKPTIDDIRGYGYDPATSTGDPTSINIGSDSYYKIGPDTWQHNSRSGHALGRTHTNMQISDIISNSDEKIEVFPSSKGNGTKTASQSGGGSYSPKNFGFRAGGEETAKFFNELDAEIGVKGHTNGQVGFGGVTFNNGEHAKYGLNKDGKPYVTWNGHDFFSAKELNDKWNGKRTKSTATAGNTSKKSMIEDVFSGNHSYSDGKSALMGLLGKGYSKKDIMEQAVQFGITWKPNDHEGINWMRASMAIQKHFNK